MEIGYVKFIRPKDSNLAKLIKGYYVHTGDEPDFFTKVTFYQNITTTISIYKNSVTSSEDRLRKQHHKKNNGFTVLLAGLVDKYQEVEFYGPLDRLAIVFHPGGINHFVKKPLGFYLEKHYSFFDYFQKDFDTFLPLVYNESSLDKKRDMLDAFFLNHFQKPKHPEVFEAMDILIKKEGMIKVSELAESLDLNRRTLLRRFKKHLGYSIEEYISVIKFRKVLLNFQQNRAHVNLTDIALNSNYYDQPDFNHSMKNRSGLTPKELFKQLEIVDDVLFWKL